MSRRLAAAGVAAVALLLGAEALPAQAPIVNATVERRAVAQGLAREIQAVADRGTAAWIGYRVPLARVTDARFVPSPACCGRCRLEPPVDLLMLVRVEGGAIGELRPVAVDCDIDAAGMPLVWFEAVDPDESVAWLRSIVTASPAPPQRVLNAAMVALARHAAPSAVPALTEVARTHPDRELRRQAMIRLGQSDDPRAADFLAQILLK